MPITFGGKSVDQFVRDEPTNVTYESDDPLPNPSTLRDDSVAIISIFFDHTIWMEQMLSEMSVLARKRARLNDRLREPALFDSPDRPAAMDRADMWDRQLQQMARDAVAHEAACDRYWQAMDQSQRMAYANTWGVGVSAPRLIGQAWMHIAQQYRWPKRFRLSTQWFHGLPWAWRQDMRRACGENYQLGSEPLDPWEDEE